MKIEINGDYDCYCFDVFDTIISRTVSPEYVKKLWAKEIRASYIAERDVNEIYAFRSRMERYLCEQTQRSTGCLEFRLMDLYEKIYEEYIIEKSVEKSLFLEDALKYEIDIEKRVQFVQEDVEKLLRHLKKLNKTIVCVSDFYAPEIFFEQIFKYHKIYDLIHTFYISSEYLETKRKGDLYDHVLADTGFERNRMIMIGDNQYSDYEMPKSKGLAAYLLDRRAQYDFYQQFEQKSMQQPGAGIKKIYKKLNRDDYEDLSFSLYFFTQKLFDRLRKEHIKNVFFLSREGEFLLRLFQHYQDCRVHEDKDKIRLHYLMVSRKSTFIASLRALDEEKFEMIFRQYIHISVFDFLSSLGFELEEQIKIGKQLGVDIYEKQEDLPHSPVYEKLKGNALFRKLYEEKRSVQKRNFGKYLDSFGVDFQKEPLALVDVGWKGTIQDNIFYYFGGDIVIKGYYLGLAAAGKLQEKNKKYGLLFSCTGHKSKYFAVYNENKSIFEVMLGASHGSADRYEDPDGKIVVRTSEKQEERDLYVNVIKPAQNKMESIFCSIDKELVNSAYPAEQTEDFFAYVHANLVYKPTKKQIDFFYQIYHFENFGIFAFSRFKSKDRFTCLDRIRGIRGIFDRSLFLTGFWGVASLKNAGLSVLIKPYGIYMYQKHYLKERDRTWNGTKEKCPTL